MRKILYGILALAAVFFGSCVNENENPSPIKAGEVVNVKFTAGLQSSPKQGTTRAADGIGNEDTGLSGLANLEAQAAANGNTATYCVRYIVQITDVLGGNSVYDYRETKDIDGDPAKSADLRTLTFSATLTTGAEYQTVIWADITKKSAPSADLYYRTSGWPEIELTPAALTAVNDEAKDAYFVTDTRVNDGQTIALTLRRPLGKIRFLARDYSALDGAGSPSEQDEMTTASEYLPATLVYTKFDASTGDVDLTPATQQSVAAASTSNSAENGELATFWDYVLAPSADQAAAGAANPQIQFTVDYSAHSLGVPKNGQKKYEDPRIVVERNRLTTVRDNLFDFNRTKFVVTVDDSFDGEDTPLRATVRYMNGDTAHISIQRDANGEATFSCWPGAAGITLVNTSTEILIGSAGGQQVTLKFNPLTNGILPRTNAAADTTFINTVAELAFVKQNPAGTYKMDGDIDLAVYGTAGSPAVPLNWVPIGSTGNSFTGTFDGDGHTVSNLEVSSGSTIGFFGQTNTGVIIKNLGVSGNVSGAGNVGGIVGQLRGAITACSFNGTVTGTGNTGGIVGSAYVYTGTITACHSAGIVSGVSSVGGLVGNIGNSYNVVRACYSTATVSGTGSNIGSIYGARNGGGNVVDCFTNKAAQTDVTVFGAGATEWPVNTTTGWGVCLPDFSDIATNHWKDLGSWNSGAPVYPKLWWE